MVLMRRQTSCPGAYDYESEENYMIPNKIRSRSDKDLPHIFSEVPEYSPYASPKSKKKNSNNKCSTLLKRLLIISQYVAFASITYFLYDKNTQLAATSTQFTVLNNEFRSLESTLFDTEKELTQANSEFFKLKMKVNSQLVNKKLNGLTPDTIGSKERQEVSDHIVKRQDAQSERILKLQTYIQDIQRFELEQRYGPGPYTVEFTVSIEGKKHFFSVQTAPNELMPHAVKTFMQMVENGGWNDSVMVHKVGHIALASPVSASSAEKKDDKLFQALAFPEYSEQFNHAKYTLGFSGRPGGPQFYINLNDNSVTHGPGGQHQHTLAEEADPCFATITRGKDVVEKFIQLTAKAQKLKGDEKVLYSTIEQIKILNDFKKKS